MKKLVLFAAIIFANIGISQTVKDSVEVKNQVNSSQK